MILKVCHAHAWLSWSTTARARASRSVEASVRSSFVRPLCFSAITKAAANANVPIWPEFEGLPLKRRARQHFDQMRDYPMSTLPMSSPTLSTPTFDMPRREPRGRVGRSRRAIASVMTGVMMGTALVPSVPGPADRPSLDRAGLVAACASAQITIGNPTVLVPKNERASALMTHLAPLPRGAVVRVTDSSATLSSGRQRLSVNGQPWGVVATSFNFPYHDTAWVQLGAADARLGNRDWSHVPEVASAASQQIFRAEPGVVGAIDVRTPTQNPFWVRVLQGVDGSLWVACLPQRAGDPAAPIRLFKDGRLAAVAYPTMTAGGTSTYRLRAWRSREALLDLTVPPKVEGTRKQKGTAEYRQELRTHEYDQSNVTITLHRDLDPTLPFLVTQLFSTPLPSAIVDESVSSNAAKAVHESLSRKDLPMALALLDSQPVGQRILTGGIYNELYGEPLVEAVQSVFDEVHPQADEKDRAILESALAGGGNMVAVAHRGAALKSSTAARIVENASRFSIRYTVVPDEQYDTLWPGSVGVVVDGRVFLKRGAIFDGGITVIHEDLHIVLGSALKTSLPQVERIQRTREAFAEMKLSPELGERIARATAGWPEDAGVAAEHVAIAVLATQIRREESGLEPFASPAEQVTIEQVARRTLAEHLLNRGEQTSETGSPDTQLLIDWNSAAVSSVATRVSTIQKLFERLNSDEDLPVG